MHITLGNKKHHHGKKAQFIRSPNFLSAFPPCQSETLSPRRTPGPLLCALAFCFLFLLHASNQILLTEIVSHIYLLHGTTSERFSPTGTADDCHEKNVRRRAGIITALVFVNTDVKVAAAGKCRHFCGECLKFSPPPLTLSETLVYKHVVATYEKRENDMRLV